MYTTVNFYHWDTIKFLDLLSTMGIDDYKLIEILGSGSFGTAHLAEKKKSGKKVVIKEKG